jgi:hypothetical protein
MQRMICDLAHDYRSRTWFCCPLLRGGAAAPIKQMSRYLRIGAAGEVRHWHKSCDALSSYGEKRPQSHKHSTPGIPS